MMLLHAQFMGQVNDKTGYLLPKDFYNPFSCDAWHGDYGHLLLTLKALLEKPFFLANILVIPQLMDYNIELRKCLGYARFLIVCYVVLLFAIVCFNFLLASNPLGFGSAPQLCASFLISVQRSIFGWWELSEKLF